MDTMPANDPMEKPRNNPLAGLNPADLLRQGVAEDTLAGDGAPPFTPPPPEELAPLFPQFEILELIGKGGMGAVFKVRQKDLDRIVALKILPPAIGRSPEFSARFTREAKALAKLNHPGIVILHEFGQQEGLYFILMEFVDGVNLAQLMNAGRISPREALAIVPQICDALQFAHDQGIVHRDIKPENILLDRLGRVKVAGFGIAKVVEAVCDRLNPDEERRSQTDATLAGKIIGSPAYMAPEQIHHPTDVDHRADIYALGVVFCQMLTGELPGKRLEAPSKKVHIDVRLDEIVLRAMEKNPELRFQQASVMKTRVESAGSGEEVVPARRRVEPDEATKHEPPAGKSRSIVKMIAIGCGVLALVGLGAAFWFGTGIREEEVRREVQAVEQDVRRKVAHAKARARQANEPTVPESSSRKSPTAHVTGTLVLPKDFSDARQAAVAKAALDLLATCSFSEGSSESEMFNAKNGIAHIWITFSDGLTSNHPDEILVTFPLASGSVWTRRGNNYERHAKFTPEAAVVLSAALGLAPSTGFAEAAGAPE
jgi:serine/threonine protein kinase